MKWPFAMRWRLDVQRASAKQLRSENERLCAIIKDVAPFVGYSAHVPELVARVEAIAYPEDQMSPQKPFDGCHFENDPSIGIKLNGTSSEKTETMADWKHCEACTDPTGCEAHGCLKQAVALLGDWPEDFKHENGNYECACDMCGDHFKGHKRRVICKVCAENGGELPNATSNRDTGSKTP